MFPSTTASNTNGTNTSTNSAAAQTPTTTAAISGTSTTPSISSVIVSIPAISSAQPQTSIQATQGALPQVNYFLPRAWSTQLHFPKGWTRICEELRVLYRQDIVKSYQAGASLGEIAARHELDLGRHTAAILKEANVPLRSPYEEGIVASQRVHGQIRPLPLDMLKLRTLLTEAESRKSTQGSRYQLSMAEYDLIAAQEKQKEQVIHESVAKTLLAISSQNLPPPAPVLPPAQPVPTAPQSDAEILSAKCTAHNIICGCCLPFHWDRLDSQEKQAYMAEVLIRYNNGENKQSIAKSHGISLESVNGLLILNPNLVPVRLRSSHEQNELRLNTRNPTPYNPLKKLRNRIDELRFVLPSARSSHSSASTSTHTTNIGQFSQAVKVKRKKSLPASSVSSGITQRVIQPKPSQETALLVPVMINNMLYSTPQGALTLLNQPQPVFAPATQSTPTPSQPTPPSKKPHIDFGASQTDSASASTSGTAKATTPSDDPDSESELVIDLDTESPMES